MRPDEQIGESAIKAASQVRHANTVSVIVNIDEETQNDGFPNRIPLPVLKQSETWKDVRLATDVKEPQKSQISQMLESYLDIFTDMPGRTTAIQHVINLSENKPITVPQYTITYCRISYILMSCRKRWLNPQPT